MNRRIAILATVLGVQIVLGAALNFGPQWVARAPANLNLPVNDAGIDRIDIASKDASVKLVRREGTWRLPDYFDLPASAEGVKLLLDRLGKIEGGTPVATSEEARKRFRVGSDDFERRIVMTRGEKPVLTLFIGSPAARNRSHLRVEGQDAIYEDAPASYELRPEAANWVDKQLLAVPKAQIVSLTLGNLSLKTIPGATAASAPGAKPIWQAEGVAAGQVLNQEAAAKLVDMVAQLSFEAVLGTENKPEYGLAQPMVTVQLGRKEGEARDYQLSKLANEEAYALKVSDRKELFKLLAFQAKPLLDAARSDEFFKPVSAKAD